jgi:hypothetical protein
LKPGDKNVANELPAEHQAVHLIQKVALILNDIGVLDGDVPEERAKFWNRVRSQISLLHEAIDCWSPRRVPGTLYETPLGLRFTSSLLPIIKAGYQAHAAITQQPIKNDPEAIEQLEESPGENGAAPPDLLLLLLMAAKHAALLLNAGVMDYPWHKLATEETLQDIEERLGVSIRSPVAGERLWQILLSFAPAPPANADPLVTEILTLISATARMVQPPGLPDLTHRQDAIGALLGIEKIVGVGVSSEPFESRMREMLRLHAMRPLRAAERLTVAPAKNDPGAIKRMEESLGQKAPDLRKIAEAWGLLPPKDSAPPAPVEEKVIDVASAAFERVAEAMTRPSTIFRPKLSRTRSGGWRAYHDNVWGATGNTPAEAMANFDKAWEGK